jgi:hypothetical protein
VNEDLIKFYNVLKQGYPDTVANMTPDEFVSRVGDRGKFISFLDVLPQVDPDVFKSINRQEVLDRVYPIRKQPTKVATKPGPVLQQGVVASDPYNLVPTLEDIEDDSLFGQLGKEADAISSQAIEQVNQERKQVRQQEFVVGAPNMPNAGVGALTNNLSKEEEKAAKSSQRLEEFLGSGVAANQYTPKELFSFINPDDSADAYENINIIERDFNKGLDEDGKLDPYAIAEPTRFSPFTIVDIGSLIRPSAKMTPDEILKAKEIEGLTPLQLQKVKQYVGEHQLLKADQERKELALYAQVLQETQKRNIPKEVLEAYKVIEELAPKFADGSLEPEEAEALKQTKEYLDKLDNNEVDGIDGEKVKTHLETLPQGYERLEASLKEIDQKYPALPIVEKLNKEIQRSYDEWYDKIGTGSFATTVSTLPGMRPYPVALKSLLNVAKMGVEVLPTLGESLNSTYNAVAGGVFGDEDAKANTIRRSNAFVQPGTLMDATIQKRSIFERTAPVNFEGQKLEVAFDDDGQVTGIYDQYDSPVNLTEEKERQLLESVETQGTFGESSKKFNESGAFNAVTDGARDLAVTLMLSKGLGSVVRGPGAFAGRVREGIPILFQYAGRTAEEGIKQGLTPDEAILWSGMQMTGEVGTEMMFLFTGKFTGAGFNTKRALNRFIADPKLLNSIKRSELYDFAIKGPMGDAVEEGTMAVLGPVINQAFNNVAEENLDTTAADWETIGTSMALGLVLGALPGVVGGIARSRQVGSDSYLGQSLYAATDPKNLKETLEIARSFKKPEYERMASILQTVHDETKDIREAEGDEKTKIAAVVAKFNAVKRRFDAADTTNTASNNNIKKEADDLEQAYNKAANTLLNPQSEGIGEESTEGIPPENIAEFSDDAKEAESVTPIAFEPDDEPSVAQIEAHLAELSDEDLDQAWSVGSDKTMREVLAEKLEAAKKREGTVKPIFSDFDNTLFDPRTKQLTALGVEIKAKIAAGEDVTILTAREDTPENRELIASQLGIPVDRIKLGLNPDQKAAELSEGSIFYDDNQDNVAAAQKRGGVEVVNTGDNINKNADNIPQKVADIERRRQAELEAVTVKIDGTNEGVSLGSTGLEGGTGVFADINAKYDAELAEVQKSSQESTPSTETRKDINQSLIEAAIGKQKLSTSERLQLKSEEGIDYGLSRVIEGRDATSVGEGKRYEGKPDYVFNLAPRAKTTQLTRSDGQESSIIIAEDIPLTPEERAAVNDAFELPNKERYEALGQIQKEVAQRVLNERTTNRQQTQESEPIKTVDSAQTVKESLPVQKTTPQKSYEGGNAVVYDGGDWLVYKKYKDGYQLRRSNGKTWEYAGTSEEPLKASDIDGLVSKPVSQKTTLASLTKTFQDVFKLPKAQAEAAARAADRMITEMSNRPDKKGVRRSKQEIYNMISFEIPSEEEFDNLLKDARKFGNNPQEVKGKLQGALVAQDGRYIIYALTNPNVTTPLHELAHVFERYLSQEEIDTIVKAAGTTKFVNGKSVPTWTYDTSEYFARGFESYLKTGIAPSPDLQTLFDKFAQWLKEIYTSVSDLITPTPQVIDIYKRMLGVNDPSLLNPLEKQALKDLGDVLGAQFQSASDGRPSYILPSTIAVKGGNLLVKNENNSSESAQYGGIISTNYDVVNSEGKKIGNVHIHQNESNYQLSNIRLDRERTGLGTAIYKTLMSSLSKPLVSGEVNNEKSRGLWDKLVKEGLATKTKEGYEGKLLSPNGKPSNLTPQQHAQVRTPEFKAWFGDWENDPANASKVVDENGEPLVVYHGSNSPTGEPFNVFDNTARSKLSNRTRDDAFWFTSDKEVAEEFGHDRASRGSKIPFTIASFLSLRNPVIVDLKGKSADLDGYYNTAKEEGKDGLVIKNAPDTVHSAQRFLLNGEVLNIDPRGGFSDTFNDFLEGKLTIAEVISDVELIIESTTDLVEEDPSYEEDVKMWDRVLKTLKNNPKSLTTDMVGLADVYAAFTSNQIKSTDNVGTFNPDDNRIQFQIIGEKGAAQLDKSLGESRRTQGRQLAEEMEKQGEGVTAIRLATAWERSASGEWTYETDYLDLKPFDIDRLKQESIDSPLGESSIPLNKAVSGEVLLAFPEFENIDVVFNSALPNGVVGFLLRGEGEVHVNINEINDPEELRSHLIHEIQHLVQDKEGFEIGTSAEAFINDAVRNLFGEDAVYDQLASNDKWSVHQEAFGKYLRAVGEVQARNAEKRSKLPEDLRRFIPIENTEDVPRYEQIFRNDIQGRVPLRSEVGSQTRTAEESNSERGGTSRLGEGILSDQEGVSTGTSGRAYNDNGDSLQTQAPSNQRLPQSEDNLGGIQGGSPVVGQTIQVRGFEVKPLPEGLSIVNGFYSPIEKTLLETKQEVRPAKQWLEIFGKSDEVVFTGLRDFLLNKNPTDKVNKSELLDYIRNNRIEILEVVKGEDKGKSAREKIEDANTRLATLGYKYRINPNGDGYLYIKEEYDREHNPTPVAFGNSGFDDLPDEVLDLINTVNEQEEFIYSNDFNNLDTQYSGYTLPGKKENYKEVLITLPAREIKSFEEFAEDRWGDITDLTPSQLKLAEEQYTYYKSQGKAGRGGFQSRHWSEPNILAHLRMDTREDVNGNNVLFLEEIQSDWAEIGRDKGFKTGFKLPEGTRLVKQRNGTSYVLYDENGTLKGKVEATTEEEAMRQFEEKNIKYALAVSPAPFVMDTNKWTKLALKYALKHGVKEGVDKIAWTTGNQQNERYSLDNHVSEISLASNGDGTYRLTLNDSDDTYIAGYGGSGKTVPPEELAETVGKELAEKLIEGADKNQGKPWKDEPVNPEFFVIRGTDLRVGGEGMKGFYGEPTEGRLGIVGSVAKSLFGEVKTTELPSGFWKSRDNRVELQDADGDGWGSYTTLRSGMIRATDMHGKDVEVETVEEAKEHIEKAATFAKTEQHSIDITPKLVAEVERGLPLFQGPSPKGLTKEEALQKIRDGRGKFAQFSGQHLHSLSPEYFEGLGITPDELQEAIHPTVEEVVEEVHVKNPKRWINVPKEVIQAIRDSGINLKNVTEGLIDKVFGNPTISIDLKIRLVKSGHDIKKQSLTKREIKTIARAYVPILQGTTEEKTIAYRQIADDLFNDDKVQGLDNWWAWTDQAADYLVSQFSQLGDREYWIKTRALAAQRASRAASALGSRAAHMKDPNDLVDNRLLEIRAEDFEKLNIPYTKPDGTTSTPIKDIEENHSQAQVTESEAKKLWDRIKNTDFGKQILSKLSQGPVKVTKQSLPKQQKGQDSLNKANSLLSQAFAVGLRNIQFQGPNPLEEGLKELGKAALYFANGNARVARDYFVVQLDNQLGDEKYTEALFDSMYRSPKFADSLAEVRKELTLDKANQKQESLLTKSRLDPVDSFIQELMWAANPSRGARLTHAPFTPTAQSRALYDDYKADAEDVVSKLVSGELNPTEAHQELMEISDELQQEIDDRGIAEHTPRFEIDFNNTPLDGDSVKVKWASGETAIYKYKDGKWTNTKTGRIAIGDIRDKVEGEFRKRGLTKTSAKVDLSSLSEKQVKDAYNSFVKRFGFEGKKLADKTNPVEEFIYNLYGIDLNGNVANRVFNKEYGRLFEDEVAEQLHKVIVDKGDNRSLPEKVASVTGLDIEDSTKIAEAYQEAFDIELKDKKRKIIEKFSKTPKSVENALDVIRSGTGSIDDYIFAFGKDYNMDTLTARDLAKFRELDAKYRNAYTNIDRKKALDEIATFLQQHKKESWATKLFDAYVEWRYGSMLNGITTLFAPLLGNSPLIVDTIFNTVGLLGASAYTGNTAGLQAAWKAFSYGLDGLIRKGIPNLAKILVTGDSPVTPFDQDVRLQTGGWWYQVASQQYKDFTWDKKGLPARLAKAIISAPIAALYRTYKAVVYFDAMMRGMTTPYNQVIKFYFDQLEAGSDFTDFGVKMSKALGRSDEVETILDKEVQDRGLSGLGKKKYEFLRRQELWDEFADQGLLARADQKAREYAFMGDHVPGAIGYFANTLTAITTPQNFKSSTGKAFSGAGVLFKIEFVPFVQMLARAANSGISFTPYNFAKAMTAEMFKVGAKVTGSKFLETAAGKVDPFTYSTGQFKGTSPKAYEGLKRTQKDAHDRYITIMRSLMGTAAMFLLYNMLFDRCDGVENGKKVRILCPKNFKKEGSVLITGPGLSSYTETVTALPGWEPNAILVWKGNKYRKVMSYDKHPIGVILAPYGWLTDKALLHHVNKAQFPDSEVGMWGSFMAQVGLSQGIIVMSGMAESLVDVNNNVSGLLEAMSGKQEDDSRESKGKRALKYFGQDFLKEHAVAVGGGNLTQQITAINRAMDNRPQLRGDNAWQDAMANNFLFDHEYDDVKINQFGTVVEKKANVFADFDGLSSYVVEPNDPNRSELEKAVLSKPELHFPGFSMPSNYKSIVEGVPESYIRDAKDMSGKMVNDLFIGNREVLFDNIDPTTLKNNESISSRQEKFITNIRNIATEHSRVEMIMKLYYDVTGENLPREEFITKSKTYNDKDGNNLEYLNLSKLRTYFIDNDIMIKNEKKTTQTRFHK